MGKISLNERTAFLSDARHSDYFLPYLRYILLNAH
jgi:hypothetical protein